jgi:TolB-like protein
VPSAAETAEATPGGPRSSVFISYASENREAARLLKEVLASSGLDVWYDESELGGGDAWDQKIRRQIRECTYFMPVISAQTEARREGYFRREWRLAVDRSHDMADDAMFLIPVAIDATTEAGARVPEKFTSVQWLRCPGGAETAALRSLATRLAMGEHPAVPRAAPPSIAQARKPAGPPPQGGTGAAHPGPPPMPPFPLRPAARHDRLKYLAEVVWWVLSSAWIVFQRFPKWVRVLISLWLLFGVLFKSCSRSSPSERSAKEAAARLAEKPDADDAESLQEAASKLDKLAEDPASGNLGAGFAKAGAEIARAVSKEVGAEAVWDGQLELEPFTADSADAQKLADEVFGRIFSRLSQARPSQVRVRPASIAPNDDAALAAAAAKAGYDYLLSGRDDGIEIVVRLIRADGAATLWTGRYAVAMGPFAVSNRICQDLVSSIPRKATRP